jgi:hypothetical protein
MKRLFILEGPDGTGKTKLASLLAQKLNVMPGHHGRYYDISLTQSNLLAAIYADSIMPAVLGERDVVLDRCWISEQVYSAAYRCGETRIGVKKARNLERLARCCKVVVFVCMPSWDMVKRNFEQRVAEEFLSGVGPLRVIYETYRFEQLTDLPRIQIDPFTMESNYAVDFMTSYLETQYGDENRRV